MASKFSDQEMADFRAAFSLFDKDGNGTISKKELRRLEIESIRVNSVD